MNDSPAALAMRGVRKTFEAENAPVRALRGVDLTVASGEFVALMGPSGCGKSTLLNLVAGLDTPDEGEISVAGEQVSGRSEDDWPGDSAQGHRLVFQFFNLLEGMTVREPWRCHRPPRRKMAETAPRPARPARHRQGQRGAGVVRHSGGWPSPGLANEPTCCWDESPGPHSRAVEVISCCACTMAARPSSWSPTTPAWRAAWAVDNAGPDRTQALPDGSAAPWSLRHADHSERDRALRHQALHCGPWSTADRPRQRGPPRRLMR